MDLFSWMELNKLEEENKQLKEELTNYEKSHEYWLDKYYALAEENKKLKEELKKYIILYANEKGLIEYID